MYAFIFCCCKWLTSFLKLAGTFFYCSTTSLILKNLIWEGRNFEVTSTKLRWTALNVSGGKRCVMPPTRRLITTVLMHVTSPLSKLKYIILTSNNETFRSVGDNDWRSNHCALRTKFHESDSQNMRNHITSDRRSKRSWSYCVLCIPFILSGSPNQCWLHTCDACLITTWRLGLRAPLVARNKFVLLTSKVAIVRTLTTTTT